MDRGCGRAHGHWDYNERGTCIPSLAFQRHSPLMTDVQNGCLEFVSMAVRSETSDSEAPQGLIRTDWVADCSFRGPMITVLGSDYYY